MKNVLLDKIEILYEDSDYIVVNKPSGLSVHSDGKTKERTLVDWILEKYPHMKEVGEPFKRKNNELGITNYEEKKDHLNSSSNSKFDILNSVIYRPGIVHRIDKETSGVLLIAKNQTAYISAKNQFQNRSVNKTYNAFLYGEIKGDKGVIDRAIGRSKNDFRKWTAQRGARGEMREAVTEYTVIKKSNGFSYVEASPKTGRTHQIRVHFKAINYPVVCDKLYAENKEPALGFERLALHARSIEFELITGEKKKIEAPLPADFILALTFFPSSHTL